MDILSVLQDLSFQGLVLPLAGLISVGAVIRWAVNAFRQWKVPRQFIYDFGYNMGKKAAAQINSIADAPSRQILIEYLSDIPNQFDKGWDDGLTRSSRKKV